MDLGTCVCGGTFAGAGIVFTVHATTRVVSGYRCTRCGEEVIDADISRDLATLLSTSMSAGDLSVTAPQPKSQIQA